MWWLFSIQDIEFPILAIKHLMASIDFSTIGPQFFLLGIVPGTNFQITFTEIVFCLWAFLFTIIVFHLCLKARAILIKINFY